MEYPRTREAPQHDHTGILNKSHCNENACAQVILPHQDQTKIANFQKEPNRPNVRRPKVSSSKCHRRDVRATPEEASASSRQGGSGMTSHLGLGNSISVTTLCYF